MIVVIRITGQVNLNEHTKNSFERIGLKRKYSCTVLPEKPEIMGVVKKLRNLIAYGKTDEKLLAELIEKRGKSIKKGEKIDAKKIASELVKGEKHLKDFNLRTFNLHPPRKGIKSRIHYPKGVLGNHGDISSLLRRML
jgi:large subunit ribosomal protein L30